MVYRFHEASVTGSRGVSKEKIWDVRVAHLQEFFLGKILGWKEMTIWNAGKEGRRLYRSLTEANQQKVRACQCLVSVLSQRHDHVTAGVHFTRAPIST